LILKYRM